MYAVEYGREQQYVAQQHRCAQGQAHQHVEGEALLHVDPELACFLNHEE